MGIQFDGINNEIKSQTKIDFPGSVGIAGSLTYEDVANVDSLGIITARAGIDVTGGLVSGVSTGANKVYIDESEDDNAFYNIPFLDSATFGDQFHTLQVDNSAFSFNPVVNALLVDKITARTGTSLTFDQAGSEKLRMGTAGQIGIAGANYGNAGQVLTSQGSGSAVAWTDQHSVLDTWSIPSDLTSPGQTDTDITTWQQLTGTYHANLGYDSSLYSSGIFSFPSTGYYEIDVRATFKSYNNPTKGCKISIWVTQDNNTYNEAARSFSAVGGSQAGTNEAPVSCKLFIKVTNTTNDKFKIRHRAHNTNPYLESDDTVLLIKKLRDL